MQRRLFSAYHSGVRTLGARVRALSSLAQVSVCRHAQTQRRGEGGGYIGVLGAPDRKKGMASHSLPWMWCFLLQASIGGGAGPMAIIPRSHNRAAARHVTGRCSFWYCAARWMSHASAFVGNAFVGIGLRHSNGAGIVGGSRYSPVLLRKIGFLTTNMCYPALSAFHITHEFRLQ